MTGFSRSANGQGHVTGDRPNVHMPFSCLEVVVAAEDVTSVAEKEMNGRSESSFGLGMSRALQILCMRVCRAAATKALPFAFFMARQSTSLWLVVLWYKHHLPPLLGG